MFCCCFFFEEYINAKSDIKVTRGQKQSPQHHKSDSLLLTCLFKLEEDWGKMMPKMLRGVNSWQQEKL